MPAIQQDRHRSVVDQVDLHFGLKLSGFDRNAVSPQFGDKFFIEPLGFGRFCSLYKRRPSSLSAIAVKGKLRDHQHPATHFFKGQIELSGGIFKDSKLWKLGSEIGNVFFFVAPANTYEDKEPLADLACDSAPDVDRSRFYPLDDSPHKRPMQNENCRM